MSGHRAGWHLEDSANSHVFDGRVIDENGNCVAFVTLGSAEAAKITAAPDLLAALNGAEKAIADAINARHPDCKDEKAALIGGVRKWVTEARAAIAKATPTGGVAGGRGQGQEQ